MKAVMDCGRCERFGSTHFRPLLEPITRRRAFELDGGSHTPVGQVKRVVSRNLGRRMAVYAQRVWAMKFKSATTDKTLRTSYGNICDLFRASETLLVDGGPEFDNKELRQECTKRETKVEICLSCSPASLRVRTQSSCIA
jgi:hypothetical protein